MENKRIVVFCPSYYKTGGTELLHQLVYKINLGNRINASICYVDVDWKIEALPTPQSFKKYIRNNNDIVELYQINTFDILIFPETLVKLSFEFPSNYKILWWLSVDNFYYSIGCNKNSRLKNRLKEILRLPPFHIIHSVFKSDLFNLHLVQSEYARLHLKSNNIIKNVLPLSDYIGLNLNEIIVESSVRKNQVLYNPVKSSKFVENLISSSNLKWVKLEKLSNSELISEYRKSKIYLDFGNHPGKDRIPREAAIFGCVIITNTEGAARNNVDIPIAREFKIEVDDPQYLIAKIEDVLGNYNACLDRQREYREKILKEEGLFEEEIKQLIRYLFRSS